MVIKMLKSALDNQKRKWKESQLEKEKVKQYQENEQIQAAEQIRRDAKRLAVLKQYETAIAEFGKALELYPVDDPSKNNTQEDIMMKDVNLFYFKCYYNMALCYSYRTDTDQAINFFERALNLNVDETSKIMALLGKGTELSKKRNILLEKGDTLAKAHKTLLSDAYTCFSEIVNMDKNNIDAWYQKGYHEYLMGEVRESVKSFDEVLRLNKRYENKANIPLFDSMKREKGIKVKATYDQEPSEAFFKTKSGHQVRNRAEMMIANFLFDNNLLFQYETFAPWADAADFRPSFYLPKFDLYIEHYGYDTMKGYKKMMQQHIKEFERKKKRLVYTVSADERQMEDALRSRLKPYLGG